MDVVNASPGNLASMNLEAEMFAPYTFFYIARLMPDSGIKEAHLKMYPTGEHCEHTFLLGATGMGCR